MMSSGLQLWPGRTFLGQLVRKELARDARDLESAPGRAQRGNSGGAKTR